MINIMELSYFKNYVDILVTFWWLFKGFSPELFSCYPFIKK